MPSELPVSLTNDRSTTTPRTSIDVMVCAGEGRWVGGRAGEREEGGDYDEGSHTKQDCACANTAWPELLRQTRVRFLVFLVFFCGRFHGGMVVMG